MANAGEECKMVVMAPRCLSPRRGGELADFNEDRVRPRATGIGLSSRSVAGV